MIKLEPSKGRGLGGLQAVWLVAFVLVDWVSVSLEYTKILPENPDGTRTLT